MKKYGNNLTCFLFYGSLVSSLVTIIMLNKNHSGWLMKVHNYDKDVFKISFLLLISLVIFFSTVLYKNLVLDEK